MPSPFEVGVSQAEFSSLSLSFLRGSWYRARQKLLCVLSELLGCLQDAAFCSAKVFQGKFDSACPEPRSGLGGAGFGAWGHHLWQHINDGSELQCWHQPHPASPGRDTKIKKLCSFAEFSAPEFPSHQSLSAISVSEAAMAGEIEGALPVRCSNFLSTGWLLLFFLLLFHFFSKELLFPLYPLAFLSLCRCKGRG